MSDLDKISSVFNAKIDSVKTKDDLQNIKTEFFGKNGQITQQFKSLGSLDPEKRKEFASNLNRIKDDLTNQLEQKKYVENEFKAKVIVTVPRDLIKNLRSWMCSWMRFRPFEGPTSDTGTPCTYGE